MPNPLRGAMCRLRAILFRRSLDDDMQAEMRAHIDRAADRFVARGMALADARSPRGASSET
jgi:hypothetical protein